MLPAEAFSRLVYGRLDPDHTPAFTGDAALLDTLRRVFPAFPPSVGRRAAGRSARRGRAGRRGLPERASDASRRPRAPGASRVPRLVLSASCRADGR